MSPFHRYATATLAFVASALAVSNLQAPSSPAAGSNVTITWSSDSSDTTPMTLSVFSADSKTFNGGLAIANNVNPQNNKITVLFPEVVIPGTYTLSLISASDASNVLASSSSFTVGPAAAPSGSAASRSATSTATAPSSSRSASLSSISASLSSQSASLSSVGASISSAANSAASSALSAASSALSSISSAASSALNSATSSGSPSSSSTTGAARALTAGPAVSLALAVVLGGFAAGALVL